MKDMNFFSFLHEHSTKIHQAIFKQERDEGMIKAFKVIYGGTIKILLTKMMPLMK